MGDKVTSTLVSMVSKQCGNTQDGLTVVTYRKTTHPPKGEGRGYEEAKVNDTLNVFDNSETRTPTLVLENHPADSRVKISKNNVFETLSSRMGTGGGQCTDGHGI